MDSAPKKFAAEPGMVFCIIIGTSLSIKRYMFSDIFGGDSHIMRFFRGSVCFLCRVPRIHQKSVAILQREINCIAHNCVL